MKLDSSSGGETFFKAEGHKRTSKIWKIFVVSVDICEVTSIEI